MKIRKMIKNVIILTSLLLLCSACVSRTTMTTDRLDGTEKEVSDKKLIWFWQDEWSE